MKTAVNESPKRSSYSVAVDEAFHEDLEEVKLARPPSTVDVANVLTQP